MAESRYVALARALAAAISDGHYPPGSMLPSELELAARHGVARGTVRAALAELERDGLLARQRGTGTRVLGREPPPGFGQDNAPLDLLIQYGKNGRRVARSIRSIIADEALAASVGVPPGSRWIWLRAVRLGEAGVGAPICASDSYIHADLAPVTAHLREETVLLCDLIERHCHVRTETVEQELCAAATPSELAGTLATEPGTPALRILRRYRDAAGWMFLASMSLHPAERFAYRTRLRRRGEAES